MESVLNCQKEILNCYATRWFKRKLKPPKKRDQKEQEIKDLKQELAHLEKKLITLRLTKMNVKLHLSL